MNAHKGSNQTDWLASHQVGHDVMVAFHVFPHADNLQEAREEEKNKTNLNINANGYQRVNR